MNVAAGVRSPPAAGKDAVDAVDAVGAVGAVDAVDAVDAVGAVGAVGAVDAVDAVDAVGAVGAKQSFAGVASQTEFGNQWRRLGEGVRSRKRSRFRSCHPTHDP
jgi:hypothetical protein